MNYHFETTIRRHLSDTHTPVELYLKLRDRFPNTFLLESSDYKSRENSYSYLCVNPVASFTVARDGMVTERYPCGHHHSYQAGRSQLANHLHAFATRFSAGDDGNGNGNGNGGFTTNGLFGYTSYDAIHLFDADMPVHGSKHDTPDGYLSQNDTPAPNSKSAGTESKSSWQTTPAEGIPLVQYHLFRHLIVFNHFNNELYLVEHLREGEESSLNYLEDIVRNRSITRFPFSADGSETSNFTDQDFLEVIERGRHHCHLGDVFQVVLSRRYSRPFRGDEFNVYRALRSINPSPYLFWFDYGSFRLFGSSPESQLSVSDNRAILNPIAGTFRRTGEMAEDKRLAEALGNDPKESAEHIMLVDMARNDLSRYSTNVEVVSFKQPEYYSHVIHLVSKVAARLDDGTNPVAILAGTLPAGTLSGAPRKRAMEIIAENEPSPRGIYGGTIGIIGLDGSLNHAIFIRSFVSSNNMLEYQAGCGIVAASDAKSELKEVNNKLSALRDAIVMAETI
jgi:anthranilate synthase component I